MRENEARVLITERIGVTNQLVTLAKAFLLSQDRPSDFRPHDVITQFVRNQGFEQIQEFVLHPNVDPEPQINQVAGAISCTLALVQALWELIHAGYFMAYGANTLRGYDQQWTTIHGHGGGTSAGWRFEEFKHVLPENVIRCPNWHGESPEAITDPDIFMLEAGVDGADPEVQEALGDAVQCLRQGLYRPAVTVLGKAMEGAWIELGLSLAVALPMQEGGNSEREKVETRLKDENRGIARKIGDVRDLYRRTDLLGQVVKSSGVRPDELDSAVIWSDVLREARNAIHFGARPTTKNSYEKIVVLFLEGAKSLGLMYRIKRTAEQTQ